MTIVFRFREGPPCFFYPASREEAAAALQAAILGNGRISLPSPREAEAEFEAAGITSIEVTGL